MPFRSVKQRNFMWAKKPARAKEWTNKYGSKVVGKKNLNETIKKGRKKK